MVLLLVVGSVMCRLGCYVVVVGEWLKCLSRCVGNDGLFVWCVL